MVQGGHIHDQELNFEALVLIADEPEDVFEIQRALTFDDQDRRLGQDTYCLVRNGATHYGGLLAWAVRDEALTLTLSDEAADVLMLPVLTQVPLDERGVAVCRAHLQRMTAIQETG